MLRLSRGIKDEGLKNFRLGKILGGGGATVGEKDSMAAPQIV